MDYLVYIFLGFLQGIFEWLPISSKGIVSLFVSYFNIQNVNPLDLALFLHIGTLIATFIYFWKDIRDLILFKDKKFVKFFIIVSFISGTLGFLIYKLTKNFAAGSSLLLVVGLGLLLTSFFQSRKIKIRMSNTMSAITVGLLQSLSAIPGVSRSGSTIFGLSLSEDDPEKILRYSYLVSIPVVLGADVYLQRENLVQLTPEVLIAIISSFVFGILSLKILLAFSKKINFSLFTLFFGFLCIIGALIGFFV
ncbi:MAG: undecaprenyl-diphosphate phosphatase [Candidatus Paceibacterota bacterium]|jgi:undecaprenyl-diphosphatase|nr:undecaprenyl-diphosphate phosphatase [bacterium]